MKLFLLQCFLLILSSQAFSQTETFEDETDGATTFSTVVTSGSGANVTFKTSGDFAVEMGATFGCGGSSMYLDTGFFDGGSSGTIGTISICDPLNDDRTFAVSSACMWTSCNDGANAIGQDAGQCENQINGNVTFTGTLLDNTTISETINIVPPSNDAYAMVTFSSAIWANQKLTDLEISIPGGSNVNYLSIDDLVFSCVLPVELTYFEGYLDKETAKLSWQTASEINNAGFEVQRSTDGVDFQKVAWVEGQGNSLETINYNFKDSKIQENVIYYYRLKQIDLDGQYSLSKIIHLTWKDANAWKVDDVVPNPVNASFVRIDIHTSNTANVQLSVYDATGNLASLQQHDLDNGMTSVQLDINTLQAGTYFVKIETDKNVAYKKFIVAR